MVRTSGGRCVWWMIRPGLLRLARLVVVSSRTAGIEGMSFQSAAAVRWLATASGPAASSAARTRPRSLTAKAGKVTIDFDNPATVPHAVEVEGNGVEEESKTVTGGKASLTVDLKPGKYEFYCPVDGHKAAGMEGTLTVK